MSIIGHGVDLIEVERIAEMVHKHGDHFLERVFTPIELAYAEGKKRRMEHLAARYAAKEAAVKALGLGLRDGMAWTDLGVVTDEVGRPELRLSGRAGEIAKAQGVGGSHVSLSHTSTHAMASVILTS